MQQIQTLIFPGEIVYKQDGTFQTTATALIFKQLQGEMSRESQLVAPDRYTLKQILEEIETIFALREFLPANITVPALETATVGRSDWDRHFATPSLRS